MSATNLNTIKADIRQIANSCDLGGFNAEFFLKAAFVDDIAELIQQKEQAAFQRGYAHGRSGMQSPQ